METFKKILPWILFGFFIMTSLAFMPSFFSILAIVTALIIAPFNKWQNIIRRFLKGKIKIVTVVALTILMLCVYPKPDIVVRTGNIYPNTATTSADATASATESASQVTAEATDSITAEDATSTKVTTTIPSTEATEEVDETTPHTHTYSAATCTTPKTCSCGATEGDALGHNWEDATCSKPKTCTVCGKTSGSVASHNYYNGSCTVCGKEDPDYTTETMVWIPTRGGEKYHSRKSCSNMDNPDYVTQSYAESMGFTPCKRCH